MQRSGEPSTIPCSRCALVTETPRRAAADDPRLSVVIASGERDDVHAWLGKELDQWPPIEPYVTVAHVTAAREAAAQDAEIQETPGPGSPRATRGYRDRRNLEKKPPPRPASRSCPGQRCAAGTPRITWSTC